MSGEKMGFESGISRRTMLGLMAGEAAALAAGKAFGSVHKRSGPPNVLFVLLDDLGYGDLACLGNPVIKTPHIDRLYADSVRFTDFHVSPSCSPTRASFMTGRYSDETGVWHTINGRSLLDPRNVTLAQCFQSSGYRTGIFGKWHLGDNYPSRPIDLGFDEEIVCGGGGLWQTPDYFGNDDTNDHYLHNGKWERFEGFSTDVQFEQAMKFMGRSKSRPFFCYLATTAPHMPFWAPPKDTAPYIGVAGLESAGFYGFIANLDSNMGRLTRFLEDQHLDDNTILIFSSDNGAENIDRVFNASMRGMKESPYDGGHRVSLFLRWPAGGLAGGRDIATLTAHIDLLPTLVEICRLPEHGSNVDGRSLCPLLFGSKAAWLDRTIVVDNQRREFLVKWKETAVMTQRWRLVNPTAYGDPSVLELYDIEKDPDQRADIAVHHPEVVRSLAAQYESWWKRASADGDRYVRIGLGSGKQSPSFLTCMDWHDDKEADKVWNQRQIREAPVANGFWAVEILRAGKYRFELRRWPREVDLPINSPFSNGKPNQKETTPGAAIPAVKARLMIGQTDQSKPIHPGDKYVEFVVQLPKGPMGMRTAFYDPDWNERGAYYVYVETL
jgi:arylsulfatase A-like enzyme